MSRPNDQDLSNDPKLVDVKAVAKLLDVSVKTVRRLRDRGELPRTVKVGRLVRWRRRDIVAYINRL